MRPTADAANGCYAFSPSPDTGASSYLSVMERMAEFDCDVPTKGSPSSTELALHPAPHPGNGPSDAASHMTQSIDSANGSLSRNARTCQLSNAPRQPTTVIHTATRAAETTAATHQCVGELPISPIHAAETPVRRAGGDGERPRPVPWRRSSGGAAAPMKLSSTSIIPGTSNAVAQRMSTEQGHTAGLPSSSSSLHGAESDLAALRCNLHALLQQASSGTMADERNNYRQQSISSANSIRSALNSASNHNSPDVLQRHRGSHDSATTGLPPPSPHHRPSSSNNSNNSVTSSGNADPAMHFAAVWPSLPPSRGSITTRADESPKRQTSLVPPPPPRRPILGAASSSGVSAQQNRRGRRGSAAVATNVAVAWASPSTLWSGQEFEMADDPLLCAIATGQARGVDASSSVCELAGLECSRGCARQKARQVRAQHELHVQAAKLAQRLDEKLELVFALMRRIMVLDAGGGGGTPSHEAKENASTDGPRSEADEEADDYRDALVQQLESSEEDTVLCTLSYVELMNRHALQWMNEGHLSAALELLRRADGLLRKDAGRVFRYLPDPVELQAGLLSSSGNRADDLSGSRANVSGPSLPDFQLETGVSGARSGNTPVSGNVVHSTDQQVCSINVPFFTLSHESARVKAAAAVEHNFGIYHFKIGEYAIAATRFARAALLEEELQAPAISITYFNMAQAQHELRDRPEALRYIRLAEEATERQVFAAKDAATQLRQHLAPRRALAVADFPDDSLASMETEAGLPLSSLSASSPEVSQRDEAVTRVRTPQALHARAAAAAASPVAVSELKDDAARERTLLELWMQWREGVCFMSCLKQTHAEWLNEMGQYKASYQQYQQAHRWLVSVPRMAAEEQQRAQKLKEQMAAMKRKWRREEVEMELYHRPLQHEGHLNNANRAATATSCTGPSSSRRTSSSSNRARYAHHQHRQHSQRDGQLSAAAAAAGMHTWRGLPTPLQSTVVTSLLPRAVEVAVLRRDRQQQRLPFHPAPPPHSMRPTHEDANTRGEASSPLSTNATVSAAAATRGCCRPSSANAALYSAYVSRPAKTTAQRLPSSRRRSGNGLANEAEPTHPPSVPDYVPPLPSSSSSSQHGRPAWDPSTRIPVPPPERHQPHPARPISGANNRRSSVANCASRRASDSIASIRSAVAPASKVEAAAQDTRRAMQPLPEVYLSPLPTRAEQTAWQRHPRPAQHEAVNAPSIANNVATPAAASSESVVRSLLFEADSGTPPQLQRPPARPCTSPPVSQGETPLEIVKEESDAENDSGDVVNADADDGRDSDADCSKDVGGETTPSWTTAVSGAGRDEADFSASPCATSGAEDGEGMDAAAGEKGAVVSAQEREEERDKRKEEAPPSRRHLVPQPAEVAVVCHVKLPTQACKSAAARVAIASETQETEKGEVEEVEFHEHHSSRSRSRSSTSNLAPPHAHGSASVTSHEEAKPEPKEDDSHARTSISCDDVCEASKEAEELAARASAGNKAASAVASRAVEPPVQPEHAETADDLRHAEEASSLAHPGERREQPTRSMTESGVDATAAHHDGEAAAVDAADKSPCISSDSHSAGSLDHRSFISADALAKSENDDEEMTNSTSRASSGQDMSASASSSSALSSSPSHRRSNKKVCEEERKKDELAAATAAVASDEDEKEEEGAKEASKEDEPKDEAGAVKPADEANDATSARFGDQAESEAVRGDGASHQKNENADRDVGVTEEAGRGEEDAAMHREQIEREVEKATSHQGNNSDVNSSSSSHRAEEEEDREDEEGEQVTEKRELTRGSARDVLAGEVQFSDAAGNSGAGDVHNEDSTYHNEGQTSAWPHGTLEENAHEAANSALLTKKGVVPSASFLASPEPTEAETPSRPPPQPLRGPQQPTSPDCSEESPAEVHLLCNSSSASSWSAGRGEDDDESEKMPPTERQQQHDLSDAEKADINEARSGEPDTTRQSTPAASDADGNEVGKVPVVAAGGAADSPVLRPVQALVTVSSMVSLDVHKGAGEEQMPVRRTSGAHALSAPKDKETAESSAPSAPTLKGSRKNERAAVAVVVTGDAAKGTDDSGSGEDEKQPFNESNHFFSTSRGNCSHGAATSIVEVPPTAGLHNCEEEHPLLTASHVTAPRAAELRRKPLPKEDAFLLMASAHSSDNGPQAFHDSLSLCDETHPQAAQEKDEGRAKAMMFFKSSKKARHTQPAPASRYARVFVFAPPRIVTPATPELAQLTATPARSDDIQRTRVRNGSSTATSGAVGDHTKATMASAAGMPAIATVRYAPEEASGSGSLFPVSQSPTTCSPDAPLSFTECYYCDASRSQCAAEDEAAARRTWSNNSTVTQISQLRASFWRSLHERGDSKVDETVARSVQTPIRHTSSDLVSANFLAAAASLAGVSVTSPVVAVKGDVQSSVLPAPTPASSVPVSSAAVPTTVAAAVSTTEAAARPSEEGDEPTQELRALQQRMISHHGIDVAGDADAPPFYARARSSTRVFIPAVSELAPAAVTAAAAVKETLELDSTATDTATATFNSLATTPTATGTATTASPTVLMSQAETAAALKADTDDASLSLRQGDEPAVGVNKDNAKPEVKPQPVESDNPLAPASTQQSSLNVSNGDAAQEEEEEKSAEEENVDCPGNDAGTDALPPRLIASEVVAAEEAVGEKEEGASPHADEGEEPLSLSTEQEPHLSPSFSHSQDGEEGVRNSVAGSKSPTRAPLLHGNGCTTYEDVVDAEEAERHYLREQILREESATVIQQAWRRCAAVRHPLRTYTIW